MVPVEFYEQTAADVEEYAGRKKLIKNLHGLQLKIKSTNAKVALTTILRCLEENLQVVEAIWKTMLKEIWNSNKFNFNEPPAAYPFPRNERDDPDLYKAVFKLLGEAFERKEEVDVDTIELTTFPNK